MHIFDIFFILSSVRTKKGGFILTSSEIFYAIPYIIIILITSNNDVHLILQHNFTFLLLLTLQHTFYNEYNRHQITKPVFTMIIKHSVGRSRWNAVKNDPF